MRIGIVGFGFMGRMHFANWSRCEGVSVASICDRNPDVLKDPDKPIGNIDGSASSVDLSQLHIYSDPAEMLQSERLDAVSVTLPTHLHAAVSIRAFEAGVHVLCEKPMALTTAECDAMIAASRSSGKHLMIGHCIRFWPEYVMAKEIIDSGRYGRVLAATFQRLSAAPTWSGGNWLMDDRRSGGMVLDLRIHDSDYVQYVFGMPDAVCSHATVQGQNIVHIQTHYDFGGRQAICAEGSWAASPSFGFEMSFNIMLERAALVYDCTRQPAFRICPAEGKAFTPPVAAGDGYAREISYFTALIQGKNKTEVLTPAQSKDSVRLIEAERRSALEGRKIAIK